MTERRLYPSLQEIVEALATGEATEDTQRAAAFVIFEVWRGRLPIGIALNRKGRKTQIPWFCESIYSNFKIDGVFLDENDLQNAFNAGKVSPSVQKYAAMRMAEIVRIYGDLAENGKKHRACVRKLTTYKEGCFVSILIIAERFKDQGSRRPILDAMRNVAEKIEFCGIERIEREYRAGFSEWREQAEVFVSETDGLISKGIKKSDALMIAGRGLHDVFFTPYMLGTLYRHTKRKS